MRKRRNLTDNCLNQGKRRKKKKQVSSFAVPTTLCSLAFFSCSLVTAFAASIWVHLFPNPCRLEDLFALSGCRVWACFGVGPCCCGREAWACLLACLDHLKVPIHPFQCFAWAPGPAQLPWSMVSVVLHLSWKILNRFIQKLQWRQAAFRYKGLSLQLEKREGSAAVGASNKWARVEEE